jgi:mannose-6-phosphate isomerase-like protein (cupin superfamily)
MKIKSMLQYTVIVIASYLAGSIVLHHYLFPLEKIAYTNYFKPGDQFNSITEGFKQTIISIEGDWLNARLVIQPHAPGPPEHVHADFDETFTVKQGVLSVLINGERTFIKAGESVFIPKGTAHKPFNESDQEVIVETKDGEKTFPTKFAYYLKQLYPVIDDMGENKSMLKIAMQLSVYGNDMDTWIAGPPIGVQKALRFILAPTARLMGYKNSYEPARKSS